MSSTLQDPGKLAQLQAELVAHQSELEEQAEELRRRTEAAELARRQFQVLFESLPLPAMVVDEHGMVVQNNTLAEQWFGDSGSLTHRLRQSLGRMEWRSFLDALRKAATVGQSAVTSLRLLDPGDHVRCVDLHISRVPRDYHLDPRFSILMMDRTAEVERDADRHLFDALLSGTEDMIYATDTSGRFLLANRAYAENFGVEAQVLEGRTRLNFMPVRDAIAQDRRDTAVAQSGMPSTEEEDVQSATGSRRLHVLSHRFPLRNRLQEVIGVGGILRDMSSEYEHRQQSAMSEAVFVNATEAIIVADADTRIQRVNPAFERLTGFTAASVIGHRTALMRSGRQDSDFYRVMWQQLQDVGRWEGELVNRHASGTFYTVWAHIVALRDVNRKITGYIAVEADVTQLKSAQNLLERMASFDGLTNLPNRSLVMDRLDKLISLSLRQTQHFALLFCDLDHFKEVNDSLGHQVGDQLLRALAERMSRTVRSQDTVARWGGDEFLFLLPGADATAAKSLAHKLLARINEPIELPGMPAYRPEGSFGVAVFPEDGAAADLLIRSADTAMYAAKAAGRGRVALYSQAMGEAMTHSFDLTNALKRAVANGELVLHVQPKFLLDSGDMCGGEVLIRWERPGVGLVSPADFLPVAERAGLLVAIDRWVISQSVHQLGAWQAAGHWPEGWRLAVNQTSADLQQTGYAEQIHGLLDTSRIREGSLEIEINEGTLVQPSPQMLATLDALRALGVTLSIDDFGTGYSSLAYLKQLPIQTIKIDQAFVRNMMVSENDRTLVEAMITLGHKMGYELVAEGIETPVQLDVLKQLGCTYGQGFLVGRPVPVEVFEAMLRGRRSQGLV